MDGRRHVNELAHHLNLRSSIPTAQGSSTSSPYVSLRPGCGIKYSVNFFGDNRDVASDDRSSRWTFASRPPCDSDALAPVSG